MICSAVNRLFAIGLALLKVTFKADDSIDHRLDSFRGGRSTVNEPRNWARRSTLRRIAGIFHTALRAHLHRRRGENKSKPAIGLAVAVLHEPVLTPLAEPWVDDELKVPNIDVPIVIVEVEVMVKPPGS